MFSIDSDNGNITLTRGDSAVFKIEPTNYTIQSTDEVIFAIKKKLSDSEPSLVVFAEDGVFTIAPDDTEYLSTGSYFYGVRIVTEDKNVYTPCEGTFMLQRGVFG